MHTCCHIGSYHIDHCFFNLHTYIYHDSCSSRCVAVLTSLLQVCRALITLCRSNPISTKVCTCSSVGGGGGWAVKEMHFINTVLCYFTLQYIITIKFKGFLRMIHHYNRFLIILRISMQVLESY